MSKDLKVQVVLSAIDKLTAPFKSTIATSNKLSKAMKTTREQLKNLGEQNKTIEQFKKLEKELSSNANAIETAKNKARILKNELKNTTNPTAKLNKAFAQSTAEVKKLQNAHTQQINKLKEVRTTLSNAGLSTNNLGASQLKLDANIKKANNQLTTQTDRLKRLNEAQKRSQQIQSKMKSHMGQSAMVAGAGAGAMYTGVRAARIGSNVVGLGIDFEATMSRVQALTGLQKNSDVMNSLNKQARQLGATTSFTSKDVAEGQAFLAMAGFTPENIQKTMPGMLNLSRASGTDLGNAADISSNILTAYGLDASEMGRVADVLTKTFISSNTSLEMVGQSMKYMGPNAKALGISLEEASVMTGILGNAGIQADMAGTSLRMGFQQLSAPTAGVTKQLKALGVTAKDSKGNIRPTLDLLTEINDATKNMGTGDRLEAIKKIFGARSAGAFSILMESAETGEYSKFLSALQNSAGTAQEVSDIMSDNVAGDIMRLNSVWEDLKIQFYESNKEWIKESLIWIKELIEKINQWAIANPELISSISKVVAGIIAVTTVAGSLLIPVGLIAAKFFLMRFLLAKLGISFGLLMSPVGLVIAALILGATLIYKYWQPIKAFFAGLFTGISQAFQPIKQIFISLSPAFNYVLNGLKQLFSSLFDPVNKTNEELAEFSSWGETIGFIFGMLITGPIKLLIAGIKTIADVASYAMTEVKLAFNEGLIGIGKLIINWSPLGLFYTVMKIVTDYFGFELPNKFTEFGGMLMDGFTNGIKNKLGSIKDTVMGVGDSVVDWLKEKLDINSPSRVFAQLGDFTMQGLEVGIENNAFKPLQAVNDLTKQAAKFAGIGLLASSVAHAQPFTLDTRAPLASSNTAYSQPSTAPIININIYPGANQSSEDIAQAVARELEKFKWQQQANARSRLTDFD